MKRLSISRKSTYLVLSVIPYPIKFFNIKYIFMNIKEYQKQYKQRYKHKNKIITFPLDNNVYEDLTKRANYFNLTTNAFAKKLLIELLQKASYQISFKK